MRLWLVSDQVWFQMAPGECLRSEAEGVCLTPGAGLIVGSWKLTSVSRRVPGGPRG